MNKSKIAFVFALSIVLMGCFGSSDTEIENRELQRQVDTLNSRLEFLQNEVDRTSISKELVENEVDNSKEKHLVCGGLASFLCPDGYTCLDKEDEPNATGVCIALDKIAEYRAKQEEEYPDPKTDDKKSDTETLCGVLGEKLNRNSLMGDDSRQCCDGLIEDRASKSYSICRKGNAVVEKAPIIETEKSVVKVKSEEKELARINERCGGVDKILCAGDLICKTRSAAPDSIGTCVTNKDFCAMEGEVPMTTLGMQCCAGLEIKDGKCTEDYGEYRQSDVDGSAESQDSGVDNVDSGEVSGSADAEYNVKGYAHYETKNGGFRIKYPAYWYYAGYGATGNSLWLAGFSPDELNDEGTNIVISAKLKEGTPDSRSWTSGNYFCTNSLSDERYIEVSGSASLSGNICEMADSTELIGN